MQFLFVKDVIKFDGSQLEPYWSFESFDIQGDSIIAFIGPCDVAEKYILDIRYRKKKTKIYSENMLHLVIEHFDTDLEKAILRQKLLIAILKDKLNHRLGADVVQRWGDDVYDQDLKLTVSAVLKTKDSTKIHLGVNISSKNLPVKGKGLEDYHIDPLEIATAVGQQYRLDMRSVKEKLTQIKGL